MIIMKRITQYIAIMLVAMGLFSCEKFLDQDLQQAIDANEAITNLDDAQVALNGCYDGLQEIELFSRDLFIIADLAADNSRMNAQNAGRFINIYQWTFDVTEGYGTGIWDNGYSTLYRINKLIQDIEPIETITDEEVVTKDQILGEALALRALMYFSLVNYFGQTYNYTDDASHLGVPLILEPIGVDDDPGRATVAEVYAQILLDLEGSGDTHGAIDMLGSGGTPFTIDIYGAYALLSRVYLYMEQWAEASSYAQMVINSGKYSLIPQANYKDSWFLESYETNAEQIFFLRSSATDNWSVDMLGTMYMESGYGDILATMDLISLYDAGDVRLGLFREVEGEYMIEKFPGRRASYEIPEVEVNVNVNNHSIIRSAEMYLNAAEAEAELGNFENAVTLLSTITSRAGASPVLETGDGLIDRIKLERRKELCFEGHRLWDIERYNEDIIRTDLTNPSVRSLIEYPNYLFAYPIPDREIQVNSVIADQQNPGY